MRLMRAVALRFICLVGLAGVCGMAISAPTDVMRQVELSAIDFEGLWLTTSDSSFPKDAIKAFPDDAKQALAKEGSLNFVWVNLDGQGQNEIIIASRRASGNGGTAYFILRQDEKTWRLIAEFQGGLVLSLLDSPTNFYRITSYYRIGGETYQRTYDYQNGKYLKTGEVRVPGIISHSCGWQRLWSRLNTYGNATGKSSQCDPLIADRKRAAPPSSTELTDFDLRDQWVSVTDPSFPKAAIKALPQDVVDGVAPMSFLSVDLVGDRQHELIINSPEHGGSGGGYYFVLKKNGQTWHRIGQLLGGLILSLENGPHPSPYQITSYYRSGETYQNTYAYRDGRYRLTAQVKIPRVVSDSCWWDFVIRGDPVPDSATKRKQHGCRDD